MTLDMTTYASSGFTYPGSIDQLAIDMARRIARADATTPWTDLPNSDREHYINVARIALGALIDDEFEIEDPPAGAEVDA